MYLFFSVNIFVIFNFVFLRDTNEIGVNWTLGLVLFGRGGGTKVSILVS